MFFTEDDVYYLAHLRLSDYLPTQVRCRSLMSQGNGTNERRTSTKGSDIREGKMAVTENKREKGIRLTLALNGRTCTVCWTLKRDDGTGRVLVSASQAQFAGLVSQRWHSASLTMVTRQAICSSSCPPPPP